MELRDFAEQVLFATTLEEKLRSPAGITDERPGSALVTPDAPGRPAGLQFKAQGSGKADFPGVHRLEREEERGRLLHFFANHELLATELMALALLRFPDAPAAFRKGLFQTLKDEQAHARLYMERMRECGIEFGELPVSGYFWRSVASMESPMDYVARLSLTFEQANLDFCRHFAHGFQAVGDSDTANLLEGIYRDEIGHVAYGLKWFRRWKNPDESDWEAFCRQLKFPLSPQRAKGLTLNVEGRRAAGLDAAFVAELDVYSQSKGRTPSVFVFNPFAEGFIAHGKGFTPTKHQTMLVRDLANLPQFLCRADDIVLVPQRPTVEFLSDVKQAGFPLPQFVELRACFENISGGLAAGRGVWLRFSSVTDFLSNMRPRHASPSTPPRSQSLPDLFSKRALKNRYIDPADNLCERKLGGLRPWAWGPDSRELLQPLFAKVCGEARKADECFNERIAQLYSKGWSAALLKKVLARTKTADRIPWLCTENEVGVAVKSVEEALAVIKAIRARGHHRIVAKEALGLAGQNAIRFWEPELLPNQRRWLARALRDGREVVIEPWLERELDFSVQLEMGTRHLRLCGYTGLINDRKGQFQANWADPNHARRIPVKVTELFRETPDISRRVQDFYGAIFSALEAELRDAGFVGPVGIDAFAYRTPQGESRMKPVVEINPRYTMGRLTVELMAQTCPGSYGLFRLWNQAQLRAEGFADFPACARSLSERFPLRREGEPVAKIREGVLCLNEPATAQVCLATFQVGAILRNFDRALSLPEAVGTGF